MMDPWGVLTGIAAVGLLFVLAPVVGDAYLRFRGRRAIRCPETGTDTQVEFEAGRAAFTAAFGRPLARVKSCSLWPERRACAQRCTDLPERGSGQLEPRAS